VPAIALEPLTAEHFTDWAGTLVLDSGEYLVLEDFQLDFVADVFGSDARAIWLVVPEGSGKTTLAAALALYFGAHPPTPAIPIGASSREQAEILYRQAEGFILRTPDLLAPKNGGNEGFWPQEGHRRIKCLMTGGRIQVHAADDRTADGVIPSTAFVDELHRHRDLRLYRTWRGKLQKRNGKIIAISTAGEPTSEFEVVRQKIIADAKDLVVDGPHIRAESGGMVLHDWAVRDDSQVDDMDAVAAANPREVVDADVCRAKRSDPAMTDAHWLRFTCNIPAVMDGGPWLPQGTWQGLDMGAKLEEGVKTWLGVDLGLKHDTAALVGVQERGEQIVANAQIFIPPKDGTNLDMAVLEQAIREAHQRWDVQMVGYDPWRFERSAQILGDEGFLMVEFPMTNARMAPASESLYEAIMAGRIAHDGDEQFSAHVNAGVPTETERGWRLTKRKAKDKIDALIALVIAFDLSQRNEPPQDKSVYFA